MCGIERQKLKIGFTITTKIIGGTAARIGAEILALVAEVWRLQGSAQMPRPRISGLCALAAER